MLLIYHCIYLYGNKIIERSFFRVQLPLSGKSVFCALRDGHPVLSDDITLRVGAERLSEHPAGNPQDIGHMLRAFAHRLHRDLGEVAEVYLVSILPGCSLYFSQPDFDTRQLRFI